MTGFGTILSITTAAALAAGGLCMADDARALKEAHMNPEDILSGFEERVDGMFRAESGNPLVRAAKRPPLKPGRGNYVRHYSYSMMAFAARCLYLNEMLDEANAALVENAQHYLDHPKDINDRDSFHWHAETVARLIDMYGTNGSKHPGRLTAETEAIVLRPLFEYARKFSTPQRAEYKQSQTWHVYESENHHAMGFTVSWHFARIARNRPEYREVRYNGWTPAEHYQAWNDYFVVYCRERARKGMFIEMMSPGYNSTLMKGIYNFYDFGEPAVRRAAGQLLDLYFAYWAEEQINGVTGGGKSREYFESGLKDQRPIALAWYYFGIGEPHGVNGHDLNAALSEYRPPAVVADIALDVAGRGRYEVRQRPQGLGVSGNRNPYRMNTDGGGILRYTFCDPAFIIGTPMVEARPLSDWAAISSQNRWQGVIFAGNPGGRMVPIPRAKDNRVAFNQFWSVQNKGTLITQKLRSSKDAAEMLVWISKAGLSDPIEREGIVFVEAEGAYAAVRVPVGGYTWAAADAFGWDRHVPENHTMVLDDEYAPVILEVMAKRDIASFDAFQEKVEACALAFDGPILRYTSIYGGKLSLDTSYKAKPAVNGKAIDYAPVKAFESPFLVSDYDSGVVTIRKGDRKLVLDFNSGTGRDSK